MAKRKLAAVLFADIEGYSKIMENDESKGLIMLTEFKAAVDTNVEKFDGQVQNYYGDGCLCLFDSAVDAVDCAYNIQQALTTKVPLRIGIELSDVILEDNNVYGNGVNMAARIEALGAGGNILFTKKVQHYLNNHPKFTSQSLGKFQLKNIKEKVEVFALTNAGVLVPKRADLLEKSANKNVFGKKQISWLLAASFLFTSLFLFYIYSNKQNLATDQTASIDNQKGIAVLPFRILGNAEEQAFFGEGMMEEILTQLQLFGDLRVIARTSVMQYKDTTKPIKKIGEELKVGYLLEGSVRRSGDEMVLNVALIEATKEGQIWRDSYSGSVNTANMFDFQSAVAARIATTLQAQITPVLEQLDTNVPTENKLAYDYYLRGNFFFHRQVFYDFDITLQALEMYEKALSLDPNFAEVYVRIAACHRYLYWFNYDRSESRIQLSKESLNKAMTLKPNLPAVKRELGWELYHFERNYPEAQAALLEALEFAPNDFMIYNGLGATYKRSGNFELAHKYATKTLALAPNGIFELLDMAQICEHLSLNDEAAIYYEKVKTLAPDKALGYALQARLILWKEWDLTKAKEQLTIPKAYQDPLYKLYDFEINLNQQEFEKATQILTEIDGPIAFRGQSDFIPTALQYARLYRMKGENVDMKVAAKEAIAVLENRLLENNQDPLAYISLGQAYAHAGNKTAAIANAQKATDLMPVDKGAVLGREIQKQFIEVYILVGEYEKAMDKLEYLMGIGSKYSPIYYSKNPLFRPLWDMERFDALMKKYAYLS